MRPLLLFVLGCFLGSIASAQITAESGARVAALGGAGTALADEDGGYANPASWSTLSGRRVTFLAAEAFGLADLRLGALHYAEPLGFMTLGLGARAFGFDDYRETHVHAGAARGFRLGTTRRFHLGLMLRYHRVSIPGYGAAGTVAAGVGWLVTVLPTLDVGFQATNLHTPSLAGDELPRTLALGLAYAPLPSFRVAADVYKDVRFPASLRAGVEVLPVPALALRAGATSAPSRITLGAGFRMGWIAADVATERHEVLGWSPTVSLGLHW